eukprot:g2846.t1
MTYTFDDVLGPSSTQDSVYEKVAKPVVRSILNGYSGTIFAYGQTGSGKTYTMTNLDPATAASTTHSGDTATHVTKKKNKAIGIVPRALFEIFRVMRERESTYAYEVTLSYVQIYCETIQDLLCPNNDESERTVSIREEEVSTATGPSTGCGGVFLDGASKVPVRSAEECLTLVAKGDRNRITAFTNMNAHSSRSHAALTLVLTRRQLGEEDDNSSKDRNGSDKSPSLCRSRLLFVDLAGSERVKRSIGGVGGGGNKVKTYHHHQRFEELKAINLSLSALGNCIAALAAANGGSSRRHVPFRDSKLTRLLQGSLGGNSKTALVLTISPGEADARETTSTLQFGTRAMDVPVRARRYREIDYRTLYLRLRKVVDGHDEVLAKISAGKRNAEATASELQRRCEQLSTSLEMSETERTVAESRIEQLIKALSKIGCGSAGSDEDSAAFAGADMGGVKNQEEHEADDLVTGSRSTFVLTAIANKNDARVASAAIEELSNRWHAESTRLREQIATQTLASRKRAARLAKQHERRAAELVTENGELELTLRQERESQLRTLRDFHAFRRRALDDQKERDRRIADLVADLEESRRKVSRLRTERKENKQLSSAKMAERDDDTTPSLSDDAEMKKRAQELLEATLSEDFVGRPVVAKMDHLYNEVLDKLQTRVKVLETTKVAANTRSSKSAGNARRRRQPNIPYGSRNASATTKKSSRAPLGMGGGGGLRGKRKDEDIDNDASASSRSGE